MTIEDETAIANIIVWPKTFERFRPIVLGARYVAVTGMLQHECGVIHVVADRLEDLTFMLARLRGRRRDRKPRARRRGQAPGRRDRDNARGRGGRRSRMPRLRRHARAGERPRRGGGAAPSRC